MSFYVSGIDIGLHNLGIIKCEIDGNRVIEVIDFQLIDLYKYRNEETELHMFISRLVEEYSELFNSKYILIERQPPGGLIAIQEVLAYIFKDNVTIISPRSVHSKIGLQYYDYEGRKVQSQKQFIECLKETKQVDLLEKFNKLDRKHDISDAYCLIKYFINFIIHKSLIRKSNTNSVSYNLEHDDFFLKFRLNKSDSPNGIKYTLRAVEN